jgi:ribonuclease J
MTVFETEWGISHYRLRHSFFPTMTFFDIDYLIPNTSLIPRDAKVTLVFSHGHEDHIGAFTHIIEEFQNITVWAGNFTSALLRKKMNETKAFVKILTYTEESKIKFGKWFFHPVHVNHSIPETYGFCIVNDDVDMGIFFCSDFKVDPNTPYEKPFNVEKIKSLIGKKSKRLGFIDSTNILNKNRSLSENELIEDIDEIVKLNKRVFITLFSSNIHRMQTLINVAKRHKKKIALVGRSVESYYNIAKDTNMLNSDGVSVNTYDQVESFDNFEGIIVLTGSQGDYFGALRRLSDNEIKGINLTEGDVVLFSSKPIPGNEKKIFKIYNKLTAYGAEVITSYDKKVHASGHPGQEELKWLQDQANFTDYFPIHGETLFLKRHCEFIDMISPKTKTYFLNNFTKINISKNLDIDIKVQEVIEPIIIHGDKVEIERTQISERRKMACNGVIFVSVNRSKQNYSYTPMGLPLKFDEHVKEFDAFLGRFIKQHSKTKNDAFIEELRIATRRFFKPHFGYRPLAQIHII